VIRSWRSGRRGIGSSATAIERFIWTAYAQLRLGQRQLKRFEVEQAIREGHDAREVNDGRAQWPCTARQPPAQPSG